MEERCFIFPNRRSLAFFRKYLGETVKSSGRPPVFAPMLLTMNDFFYRVVGADPAGRVTLLLKLYSCYEKLNPKHESLDDFIFWGDVLLGDFDDVDKYLINPDQLFTNVSDLRKIQDTYEYLSENQRKAVEQFLNHFRSGAHLQTGGASANSGVKAEFLQVWDILLPLYKDFNACLDAGNLSYEGKVYRALAEMIDAEPVADVLRRALPDTEKYVFVGLNALNECEKKLMRRMRDAGLASFCWDWSEGWISDPRNKSTVFMLDNLALFPQAFELEDCSGNVPEINVLSVPSAVGQAKQLPRILERLSAAESCGDMSRLGIETAIVLPDENLLVPVLNSIPPEINDINVTMGYPMTASGLYSLMSEVAALQMHLRCKDGEWYFYHKQVYAIFSNSVFKSVAGDEARKAVEAIKSASQYYIPSEAFGDDPVMKAVFRPVVKDLKQADPAVIKEVGDYLAEVVRTVAVRLKKIPDMAAELDFARDYHMAVTRLKSEELPVLPATFFRLLSQLLNQCSVPFTGEPLKGLQVMGPLETRTLDFRNLVILSANEGIFPRRSVSSSFIPPELRKGFGLPTYEYQDAVWAYYFYRMLMRAERVWMLCDSRSEGLRSGEESRYIKQLEFHFGAVLNRMVAKAPAKVGEDETDILKTAEDVKAIKETFLSASALQNYLSCPAKFYFHTVRKLVPEDEVSESLDAGMLGNVFHNTMCALYFGEKAMNPDFPMDRESFEAARGDMQKYVTRDYIKSWLSRPDAVRARIRSLIMAEIHAFEVSGRNLVFENVILEYVMKVLERDLECMEGYGTMAFEVKGLELKRFWEYDGFKFIGYIDRMDSFSHGEVRVVDYKTGHVSDSDINVTDSSAEYVVDKLFNPETADRDRPKIALQLFLYDMFVSKDVPEGGAVVNSIYSPSRLFVSPVEKVEESGVFISLMKERLSAMLSEIADTGTPFRRTGDVSTCEYCDFKNICGR